MSHSSSNILADKLLDGIRDGDEVCFEVFYRMERNNLVHFVSSYLRDVSEAEDIAQEVLLRLWDRRRSLKTGKNLRVLVFTMARNMAVDRLRRRIDTESIEACLCLEDKSVDGLIEALDLASLMARTFDNLPQKLRETFLKSRDEGLSNREIARQENVSVKAIEYRISTVLRNLKNIAKSF